MKAEVRNIHDTQAHSIRGTGSHRAFVNMSDDTEWEDERHLFTFGGPIDAPSIIPAGGVVAHEMKNWCRDRWNVPVQLLSARQ